VNHVSLTVGNPTTLPRKWNGKQYDEQTPLRNIDRYQQLEIPKVG
jgi:hypothetical protein